tara:strand:+ start:1137 stop:1355 length:219 start_codon:yes stop_codon:yes gene_type:complete
MKSKETWLANQKSQQYLQKCLKSLSKFSKEDLLEELEQLLASKEDKGESLQSLEDFYSKGGLRQHHFNQLNK